MDTTELELEILELEEKMKATRNPVVKSDTESKIAILKKKIKGTDLEILFKESGLFK